MSSDLESTLEYLQMDDYMTVVIITAVVYDYLLTLSREIDYVWRRHWTWVSTLLVLVRYCGLCWAILQSLNGSAFVPGPLIVGTAIYEVTVWTLTIFYNAADLVMILRVYAMWNRSKTILYLLLFIYVPQVIIFAVIEGIYNNPNTYLSVTVVRLVNFSACNASLTNVTPLMNLYMTIPQFVLSSVLLFLAVVQTLKQSVEMYNATKQWQPNRYLQQLARDGILYFFIVELYNITSVLQSVYTTISDGTPMVFLFLFSSLSCITLCTMMPRFIISIREMYENDRRGRGRGIDTGFGVWSQSAIGTENAAVSAIAFADVAPAQDQIVEADAEESDSIRLEAQELGGGTHQI